MMREGGTVVREDSWTAWPVYWTPVIVGALAAAVAVVLFGIIGTAVGSWKAGNEGRVTDFSGIGRVAVAYAVFASFFAFVIGGWVTARVAGIRRAEAAILHAAIAFLVATLVLVALASFGGAVFNGWYAGLAPSPVVPTPTGQPECGEGRDRRRHGCRGGAAFGSRRQRRRRLDGFRRADGLQLLSARARPHDASGRD